MTEPTRLSARLAKGRGARVDAEDEADGLAIDMTTSNGAASLTSTSPAMFRSNVPERRNYWWSQHKYDELGGARGAAGRVSRQIDGGPPRRG